MWGPATRHSAVDSFVFHPMPVAILVEDWLLVLLIPFGTNFRH